ncbi:hypothetical protein E2C01_042447 [Portunus trituberculatus]|uniref:Uncharacterized protein n=1 Tax=Portunus trituberculatus TaxID=210409 RepID=A0A5B7FT33_PORTR|nr:hypothetical protein [Portunus trituberculatus]
MAATGVFCPHTLHPILLPLHPSCTHSALPTPLLTRHSAPTTRIHVPNKVQVSCTSHHHTIPMHRHHSPHQHPRRRRNHHPSSLQGG